MEQFVKCVQPRAGHGAPACGNCGGPHRFDTAVPSAVWNEVIRPLGISEYLCTTCILYLFAKVRRSFTATLWGAELPGVAIEVRIRGRVAEDAHTIGEEANRLRSALSRIADLARKALDAECRPRSMSTEGE